MRQKDPLIFILESNLYATKRKIEPKNKISLKQNKTNNNIILLVRKGKH